MPDMTLAERAAELARQRTPYVMATVVRAQSPTSSRPGDRAIVLPDGTIEGFVGGLCSTGSVKVASRAALADGEAVLLRIMPEDALDFPETAGASIAVNPCLSGGAMEIFLEPVIPAPIVHVVGESPIARALLALGEQVGFEARAAEPRDSADGALAVVIAHHGGDELGALREALTADVPFIGIVASAKRGAALLDEYGVTPEQRDRIHTPVGIDIGAETPEEIALSILAQVVRARRTEGAIAAAASTASTAAAGPQLVVDPVCGMSVVVGEDTPHAVVDGEDFWFCCLGCRDGYVAQHGGAVVTAATSLTAPTVAAGPQLVVDPVCGMSVVVGEDTPHAVVDGEDFWFCCGGCRNTYIKQHGGEIVTGTPG